MYFLSCEEIKTFIIIIIIVTRLSCDNFYSTLPKDILLLWEGYGSFDLDASYTFHYNFPSHSCYKPVVKGINYNQVVEFVTLVRKCVRCGWPYHKAQKKHTCCKKAVVAFTLIKVINFFSLFLLQSILFSKISWMPVLPWCLL